MKKASPEEESLRQVINRSILCAHKMILYSWRTVLRFRGCVKFIQNFYNSTAAFCAITAGDPSHACSELCAFRPLSRFLINITYSGKIKLNMALLPLRELSISCSTAPGRVIFHCSAAVCLM